MALHPIEPPFFLPAGPSALPQKKLHTSPPPGVLTEMPVNLPVQVERGEQGGMGSVRSLRITCTYAIAILRRYSRQITNRPNPKPLRQLLDQFFNEEVVVVTRLCHCFYHLWDWELYLHHFSAFFHLSTSWVSTLALKSVVAL